MSDTRNLLALDNMEVVSYNGANGIGATVKNVSSKQLTFLGAQLHNNDASLVTWVQVFFRPAGEVVLGTTAPDMTFKIIPNGSLAWDFNSPIRQGSGFSIASTTTERGATGPSALTSGSILIKKPVG